MTKAKSKATGKPRVRSGYSDEHKIASVARWMREGGSQSAAARAESLTLPSFMLWVKKFSKQALALNRERSSSPTNGHAAPSATASTERAPLSSRAAPSVTSLEPALEQLEAYIGGLVDVRIKEHMRKMWGE